MKEQRNYVLQNLGRVVALTIGMLLFSLLVPCPQVGDRAGNATLHSHSNSSTLQIQFLFHSHSVEDYFKYC